MWGYNKVWLSCSFSFPLLPLPLLSSFWVVQNALITLSRYSSSVSPCQPLSSPFLQSVLRGSTGTAAASLVPSVCTALGRVTISQASVSACPASLALCVTKASVLLRPFDRCHASCAVFVCGFVIYSGFFALKQVRSISISPCAAIL